LFFFVTLDLPRGTTLIASLIAASRVLMIITSAKEVMFLSGFDCLFVSRIKQKLLTDFHKIRWTGRHIGHGRNC